MVQYYKMQECFDNCGDDDIPFIYRGRNSSDMWTKKDLLESRLVDFVDAMSAKWQIKRAEPKVLTISEWMKKEKYAEGFHDLGYAFNEGDKNGQLREWLRPAQMELRKLVNHFIEKMENGIDLKTHGELVDSIKEALENLKPPTPEN